MNRRLSGPLGLVAGAGLTLAIVAATTATGPRAEAQAPAKAKHRVSIPFKYGSKFKMRIADSSFTAATGVTSISHVFADGTSEPWTVTNQQFIPMTDVPEIEITVLPVQSTSPIAAQKKKDPDRTTSGGSTVVVATNPPSDSQQPTYVSQSQTDPCNTGP